MRIGRSFAMALLAATTMLPCWGCGLAPHSFRKLQPTPGMVRAGSIGADSRTADPHVVPALVERLDDEDPVVRMAASDELRRRTGKDFGFVAWASPAERAASIARWRAWLKAPPMPAESIRAPLPPMAADSSRTPRRPPRRRPARAKPSPPATIPEDSAS